MFTNDELNTIGLALLTRIDHLEERVEKYANKPCAVDWAGKLEDARKVYNKLHANMGDLCVH